MKKIGVLGAGTIGMSMARMLYNSGNDVLRTLLVNVINDFIN